MTKRPNSQLSEEIMRNKKLVLFAAAALGFAALPEAVAFNKITKVEPSATRATLEGGKANVKFTVSGEAEESDICGIYVEYGDGLAPDTRVVSKKDGLFPRVFEHTFTREGQYTVRVKGERVKTTFGCSGEASTTVTIVGPAATTGKAAKSGKEAAAAAPSCPGGWELVSRSFNQSTGAFSCSPKKPNPISCGPGLAYFEKGGVIGCRRGK